LWLPRFEDTETSPAFPQISGALNRDFRTRDGTEDRLTSRLTRRAGTARAGAFLTGTRAGTAGACSRTAWLFTLSTDDLHLGDANRVAGIDEVRILDVTIRVPHLRPEKRIAQIGVRDVPEGVSALDDVQLRSLRVARRPVIGVQWGATMMSVVRWAALPRAPARPARRTARPQTARTRLGRARTRLGKNGRRLTVREARVVTTNLHMGKGT
jgi:hypothetical protein